MKRNCCLIFEALLIFSIVFVDMPYIVNADSVPTPTINYIEPAEPKQSPYKQWLSIIGSGFTQESSVNLSIGSSHYRIPPERTEYISPNKIYILVGLTDAGSWSILVENPGGLISNIYSFEVKPSKIFATLDEHLLDLIDQYADDYFRSIWNITLDQYKAWIATIAWGEGGLGGYTAHSQGNLGLDVFNHKNETVKEKFRFSTGIGPFQIDRGGEPDNWHNWPTIKKLNYTETLKSTLQWHNRTFYSSKNATLEDFSKKTVWFAVNQMNVERNWKDVTGMDWGAHKKGKNEDLKWNEIKEELKSKYPSYEENVRKIGKVKWDLTFTTSEGRKVTFGSYYLTWLITARNGSGFKLFQYYYTLDESLGYEVWVWNNIGKEDERRHVFVRNFTKRYPYGALPENYTEGDIDAGFTASKPALNPNLLSALGLDLIFTIDTTGSMWDDIDNVKAAASAIVEEIDAKISDYRIAVVDYKDFPVDPYGNPGDYPFHDVLPFSRDKPSIIAAIQSLSVGGGADWEESVYSALIHSIEATTLGGWRGRDKATKVIILMGDAPPHDPEPFTGYTLSTVVDAAEKADPVHIYTIQVGGAVTLFEEIAEQTGGRTFTAESAEEVANTILEAINVIAKNPVAEAGPDQTVYQGETVVLDGSSSYDPDGTIMLYEWDTEGDGIYEWSSYTTGITTHVYETPGIYYAMLRVTDNEGLQDTDFAIITVLESADNIPPTTNLTIGKPHYVDSIGNIYVSVAAPFTLTAEDNPGGTGVASSFYRIYNSPYDTGWVEYSIPFYLSGLPDGEYSINYYSIDNVGNVEPTKTTTVILDNTPPVTTLIISEPKYVSCITYVTPDTLFILEAEDAGAGINITNYRINNSTYDSGWIAYTGPFYLTSLADGTYTIEYYSIDNVQNAEATQAINVTLFSWNHIFEDTYGRGTILKINLAHKFFQFITPDKDYGIKEATYMRQCGRTIIIHHYDDELRLITTVVDTKLDFCVAIAWDTQTGKRYFLIDKAGTE